MKWLMKRLYNFYYSLVWLILIREDCKKTLIGYYYVSGKRRDEDYLDETTEFHKIQREYWGDLLRERQIEMEAKNKFNGNL